MSTLQKLHDDLKASLALLIELHKAGQLPRCHMLDQTEWHLNEAIEETGDALKEMSNFGTTANPREPSEEVVYVPDDAKYHWSPEISKTLEAFEKFNASADPGPQRGLASSARIHAQTKAFVRELNEIDDSKLPKLANLIGLFKDNPVNIGGDWDDDDSDSKKVERTFEESYELIRSHGGDGWDDVDPQAFLAELRGEDSPEADHLDNKAE